MATWRFKLSILFASAGVPLYFFGFTSLAMQMRSTNELFAAAFWIVCLIGTTGGLFIHVMACVTPILYKKMMLKQSFEYTEETLNTLFDAVKVPFFLLFTFLVIIPSIMIGCAIVLGFLSLPAWMVALTPLCLMLVGLLLRFIQKEWFDNLPGIIMPSLGLSMVGLMAAINIMI